MTSFLLGKASCSVRSPGTATAHTLTADPVLMQTGQDGAIYYTTGRNVRRMLTVPVFIMVRSQLKRERPIVRAVFIRNDGVQSEEADGTYKVMFEYSG